MSVKILLYTLLKQIGIFLVVSFLVFRGTFVESDSLGLNLSTGVSLLLSVILWGIINLHTYWLIPGYLFQRRYKKYIIYLSCLVGFMLTAMVGAICFLGQYYVIPEQMQRLNSDLPFFPPSHGGCRQSISSCVTAVLLFKYFPPSSPP